MDSLTPSSPLAADIAAQADSRAEAWRGLRASLPVMLGFVPFALVLGAQAAQKGLSAVEVPLLTGLNFAGGSEFTAVRLWTSPPHVLLIVAMSFLVNSRHILMSAALAPYLRHLPLRRALVALFFMCDECWALALADARRRSSSRISLAYYMGVSAGLYATWVVFTALGAVLGPTMGNVEDYGFDMAFTAVFLVLLRGMWKGLRPCRPWLVSLVVAALTYRLVPGAWYVAAGALAGLVAAAVWAPKS
jgi:4-azaleucine resistance transporter AzlC